MSGGSCVVLAGLASATLGSLHGGNGGRMGHAAAQVMRGDAIGQLVADPCRHLVCGLVLGSEMVEPAVPWTAACRAVADRAGERTACSRTGMRMAAARFGRMIATDGGGGFVVAHGQCVIRKADLARSISCMPRVDCSICGAMRAT